MWIQRKYWIFVKQVEIDTLFMQIKACYKSIRAQNLVLLRIHRRPYNQHPGTWIPGSAGTIIIIIIIIMETSKITLCWYIQLSYHI